MAQFKQKLYRSTVNLSSYPDYVPIAAGLQFTRDMIHPKSFTKLVKRGYIEEVVAGVPAKPVVSTKPGSLTVGLRNETPDAAMHPPKDTTTLGLLNVLNPVGQVPGMHQPVGAEGEGNPDATIVPAPPVTHTADVTADTPTIIEGLNETQTAERVASACAWDIDPATLKGVPLVQLLDVYTRMCSKLEVEPIQFSADDSGREKLVAQMTSEFKSK